MSDINSNFNRSAAVLALAALNQPDDALAAAALNSQTVTLTQQRFTVASAVLIAQQSTNFSWAKILQRSQQLSSIPPSTANDFAVLAAKTIVSMSLTQIVDPALATASTAWSNGINALAAVGDLSLNDQTAIAALSSPTVPTWPVIFDATFISNLRNGV